MTPLEAAIERKRKGYDGWRYIGQHLCDAYEKEDNAIIADAYIEQLDRQQQDQQTAETE